MKRNLQLDLLRAAAILLVIGQHILVPAPPGAFGYVARLWNTNGWLGVELFFVLSGFLIGGLLLSEHSKRGRVDVGRFLVRRSLKIYPPYFVFLGYIIMMPVTKAFLGHKDYLATFTKGMADLWPNFLFLHTYIGGCPIGHTWSLANEEHFYLLLPAIVFFLARAGKMRAITTLCIVSIPLFILIRWAAIRLGDPYVKDMVASHLRLDALFAGVGLRGIAEYHPQLFAALRRYRLLLFITGILLWARAIFRIGMGDFQNTFGYSLTIAGSCAVLVSVYHTHASDFAAWRRPIEWIAAVLAAVGTYSYSIYLWHVTTIRISEREIIARLFGWAAPYSAWTWLLAVAMLCVVAIVSGVLISKVVEWPVLRLRDRFFPSRSSSIPAGTASQPITMESDLNNAPLLADGPSAIACNSTAVQEKP